MEKLRTTISEIGQWLIFEIPCKREYAGSLFLAFWLCGWAVGEIMVSSLLISHFFNLSDKPVQDPFALIFMMVWLGGWTVGGFFAFRQFFQGLVGKEVIKISPYELVLSKKIIFGNDATYDISEIKDLRLAPEEMPTKGAFLFDYGPRTIAFGTNIDYAEAKILAKKISEVMPVNRRYVAEVEQYGD